MDASRLVSGKTNGLFGRSLLCLSTQIGLSEDVLPLLFAFAESETVPEDILSIWSNQWISVFYWFMFHPVSSRKILDVDRRNALEKLFEGNGKERFLRFLSRASRPKRLAQPLILLAAKGIQFPAKVYFRKFYYPMIEWRNRS